MPLWLQDPKKGRTQNWRIRGTYLGTEVDQTSGTPDRRLAQKILKRIEGEIERGELARPDEPDFLSALISYIDSGRDQRFTEALKRHFMATPLSAITQARIDAAAVALYPDASAATKNRQVYTPMSAILRHAGVAIEMKRPPGSRGKPRTRWLDPDQAFALLAAADDICEQFGAMCTYLLYTGCRLSEAVRLRWEDVDLTNAIAYVRETKNGDPRTVFLPADVVAALSNLPVPLCPYTDQPLARAGSVFERSKNGRTYAEFKAACKASRLSLTGVSFHIFRHTYGAWMRRFGGLDTAGLVGTGAWKSRQSAAVYEHVDVSAEAKKAAMLPGRPGRRCG